MKYIIIVGIVQNTPLKLNQKFDSDWNYATCDGPSRLRRSVMQVRQKLDFLKESVTARRTYDGPSCTSVTTFRESFPVPNSQELKCFETVDHDGSSCL